MLLNNNYYEEKLLVLTFQIRCRDRTKGTHWHCEVLVLKQEFVVGSIDVINVNRHQSLILHLRFKREIKNNDSWTRAEAFHSKAVFGGKCALNIDDEVFGNVGKEGSPTLGEF